MPDPLSHDLRLRICLAYDRKEGLMVSLAKRFTVAERTVERLLARRRITGSILPGKSTGRNESSPKWINKTLSRPWRQPLMRPW